MRAQFEDDLDSCCQKVDDLVSRFEEKAKSKTFAELLDLQERVGPSHGLLFYCWGVALLDKAVEEMEVGLKVLE